MSAALSTLFLFMALMLGPSMQSFVYQAGVSFDVSANVTLPEPDPRFNYRHHTTNLLLGVLTDISVQATADAGGASTNGAISCSYATVGNYPTVYMAFYNASANAVFGSTAVSTDISSSSAYISQVFQKIEEIDAQGSVVATVDFSAQLFVSNTLQVIDAARGLASASFTVNKSGATFAFTMAVSSVLGQLNNGGAYITPTSVETFFEVNGYVYASSSNHLRLTIYTAHLSSASSVATSTKVTAGSGAAQIYMHFDSMAQVNGSPQQVTVSGLSDTNVAVNKIPSSLIRNQVSAHSTLTAEVREITVDFPVGVTAFTYDPSAAFGDPTFSATTNNSDAAALFQFFSKFAVAFLLASLIAANVL